MSSKAQIAANRRNAENSTGPKSVFGKMRASQNALRHGLRARKVISFDESEPDFLAFHAEIRESFAPADAVEEHLVERIAMCAWRLRRMYRVEAELIDGWRNTPRIRLKDLQIGAVFECSPGEMTRLSRYEVTLDRALHRAFVMLERRQARRRGEDVPAPIAVEITGEIEGLAAIEQLERVRAESENYQTKPISPGESEEGAETTSQTALQTS
jgi:hypothetical protein